MVSHRCACVSFKFLRFQKEKPHFDLYCSLIASPLFQVDMSFNIEVNSISCSSLVALLIGHHFFRRCSSRYRSLAVYKLPSASLHLLTAQSHLTALSG